MNLIDKFTKELQDIIVAVGPRFREVDRKRIVELCDYGEQAVAFEILCSQLGEFDIPISAEIFEKIKKLGEALNVDPLYAQSLNDIVTPIIKTKN